ncbi:MAG: tryptophan-rich sensory protein [Flavobacteriaceae bacterium]
MIGPGHILVQLQRKWRFRQGLEIFLWALGPAVLGYAITMKVGVGLVLFFLVLLVLVLARKPWQLTLAQVSRALDQKLPSLEYSSGLLLRPEAQLTDLALIQRQKITEVLQRSDAQLVSTSPMKKAGIAAAIFLGLGILIFQLGWGIAGSKKSRLDQKEIIQVQAADSLARQHPAPTITQQEVTVRYPSYTQKPMLTSGSMDVKALEGSRISWSLHFGSSVDSVLLEQGETTLRLSLKDGAYQQSMTLTESGFYNFRFFDAHGGSYITDLYTLEVTKDTPPTIELPELKQFTSFDYDEPKLLTFNALINDDYGIATAQIVATVSKGSGESVKFREEKLPFDTAPTSGQRQLNLSKKIDLAALAMTPGDELYFYVEAIDTKRPKPNTARSETYFAVIKDTVTDQFAVEATMGADLMPDYFRSQRQLIIDTEKLIANKARLSKEVFNATSNELGFDQKALRLKYGQFMGDEAEAGPEPVQEVTTEEDESGNPLAEYTHDHDGANEHNLVDHDHDHEEEGPAGKAADDPLEAYLHNHEDPEASSLFTQSLKSMLRQAMSEMWDAELHLRLYTPQNSLPYQYRALKLLQEIKNSARIYVHRIGFDPPPIKEDARLTGKIEEVSGFQKQEDLTKPLPQAHMRSAVARLQVVLAQNEKISGVDKELFSQAGQELAAMALAAPGSYLKTLQGLKWLSEDLETPREQLYEVMTGLMQALPNLAPDPHKSAQFQGNLDKLVQKELEAYDE